MPDRLVLVLVTISAVVAAYLAVSWPLALCAPGNNFLHWLGNSSQVSNATSDDTWDVRYHLGGNGPWIPRRPSHDGDNNLHPPQHCTVEQVHMLSRHGERYPTLASGIRMLELYHRLVALNATLTGPLSFFNTYNFFMPDPAARLENLVPVGPYAGTLQAFETGVKLRTRYESLVARAAARGQTRFWATDSRRIMDTAAYFAAGLHGLDWRDSARAELQIVPEDVTRGADTLTPGRSCPAYRDGADVGGDADGRGLGLRMLQRWQETYLPSVRSRLQRSVPSGVEFTLQEVFTMQEMCGFETLARGSSPWCDVFTRSEWEDFEYARDLLHYYRSGPGNRFGPALGWLFLNATANVLSQDADDVGELFVSFVHDGDLLPFVAALELFPQRAPLTPEERMDNRAWRTSEVVPMGGRIILEKLVCQQPPDCWSNAPFYPNHVYCDEQPVERFVRINVNDAIVGLPGCEDGPGRSCALDRFGEYVRERGKAAGDFRTLCGLGSDAPGSITFLKQPSWSGEVQGSLKVQP